MLSIRIENKIKTEWRDLKSKIRSLYLFGSINKVKFGFGVQLIGKMSIGKHVYIGDYSKIRAKNLKISDGVHIKENVFIRASFNINIGKGTTINKNTCILDKVVIGEKCSIAPNCVIVGSNHNFMDKTQLIKEQGSSIKGIVIEDDVWIAANVTILDGVVIGKGAVVAAGAVVAKDVESYTVVGGVPAKTIGKRT